MLYSMLAEESAAVSAAWAEDLPALAAVTEEKSDTQLDQVRFSDYFKKSLILSTEQILEDANHTPAASVSTPVLYTPPPASFSEATQTLSLPEDIRSFSDASSASSSSSSSSQARATTPDTEVPSVPCSPTLEATKPQSSPTEGVTKLDGDLMSSASESEVVADSSDYPRGAPSNEKLAAETDENLQKNPAAGIEQALEASQPAPAAVSDTAEVGEGSQALSPQGEASDGKTDGDLELLRVSGDDAQAAEPLQADPATEPINSPEVVKPKFELAADEMTDDGSALLEEGEVPGPSTERNQSRLFENGDSAQLPGDLQKGFADANDQDVGATQSDSAVENDALGDPKAPYVLGNEFDAEIQDAEMQDSTPDEDSASSIGDLQANNTALNCIAQDSAAQPDNSDTPMEDAASSNGDTASLNTPAKDTDSFSTDLTSSEMDDVSATSAAASLPPPDAASFAPAVPSAAPVGPAQPQPSPATADADMADADDSDNAGSLSQAQQPPAQPSLPPAQLPLPPVQQALPSLASDQAVTEEEDIEMAFQQGFSLHPASSTPETGSYEALRIVPAASASSFPTGTTPAAETSQASQEPSPPLLAPAPAEVGLPNAAPQAASPTSAASTVLSAATDKTKASTSVPVVAMYDTQDDGSSSGSAAQAVVQSGTMEAISAAAQEGSQMDDVQSSLDASSPDASPPALEIVSPPARVPGDHSIWGELSDLGSRVLGYLKTEIKRGVMLDLPGNVVVYVRNAKASPMASQLLINLMKASSSVTLLQLVALRDRVRQARSRDAAARVAPPMRSAKSQPAPIGDVSADSTIASAHSGDSRDVTVMLELLRPIHERVANQPHISNFKEMFDLPWDDNEAMMSIVAYIVRNKDWGKCDQLSTRYFLGNMLGTNLRDGTFLIWSCNVHWYKSRLQPIANLSCNARWAEYRVVALRKLFDHTAKAFFELIQTGSMEKPRKPMT